jgi:hypothetical protein
MIRIYSANYKEDGEICSNEAESRKFQDAVIARTPVLGPSSRSPRDQQGVLITFVVFEALSNARE